MEQSLNSMAGKCGIPHTWPPTPWTHMLAFWHRLMAVTRRSPRRLRLCESLPLGERRFVAVIEFEDLRFLLGGTSSSLVLLARLDREGSLRHGSPSAAANEETP